MLETGSYSGKVLQTFSCFHSRRKHFLFFFGFLKLNDCCRELGLRFCGFWKEEEEGGVEGGRLLEVWHHWDWWGRSCVMDDVSAAVPIPCEWVLSFSKFCIPICDYILVLKRLNVCRQWAKLLRPRREEFREKNKRTVLILQFCDWNCWEIESVLFSSLHWGWNLVKGWKLESRVLQIVSGFCKLFAWVDMYIPVKVRTGDNFFLGTLVKLKKMSKSMRCFLFEVMLKLYLLQVSPSIYVVTLGWRDWK